MKTPRIIIDVSGGLAYQQSIDLRKVLAAIIDARDRAALADDPAYYEIDRAIDNARKIIGMNDESS